MFNRDFLSWLAGFVELSGLRNQGEFHLDEYQRKVILAHVNLVKEVTHDQLTLFSEYILEFIHDGDRCKEDTLKTSCKVNFLE